MSDNMKKVLIVGTGEIAGEYCKVLKKMGICPDVVGRDGRKAEAFGVSHGVNAFGGGAAEFISNSSACYDFAIVATGVMQLCETVCCLIQNGVKQIFCEKPGGMNRQELEMMDKLADENGAQVYIAYNRRFYASTSKAMEMIEEDGGVKSFYFEFTEWAHTIEPQPIESAVKEEWFLANSTHVADLAFFLGGEPRDMTSYVSGALSWHSRGCIYSGAGVTDKEALFSYHANWAAPGRWAVEILTSRHRLYFKPMEKLAVQEIGSVAVNPVQIEDELDCEFKPGFYKEVESFINQIPDGRKKTLKDQLRYMGYFEKMEGKKR